MYTIEYSQAVLRDIKKLHVYRRKTILDVIEKQLAYEPMIVTRHRKPIIGLIPPWEHLVPVWELCINEYRVFYDVDKVTKTVIIRAIRHKPSHRTTEEIL